MPDWFRDEASGMPAIRTPSGAVVPLPLTPEQLAAAGIRAPAAPAAPGMGDAPPMVPTAAPMRAPNPNWVQSALQAEREQAAVNAMRAKLSPPPAPPPETPGHAAPPVFDDPRAQARGNAGMRPDERYNQPSNVVVDAPPGTPANQVDPAELAQHGGAQGGSQPADDNGRGIDPIVQAVYEESLRGGGGGGPRRLGVTGQTRKYKELGYVPDEVAQGAREASDASDKYNEELAKSINARQEEIYAAGQAEYQARIQAISEQRAREVEQRRMLGEYQARRDAVAAEAAQMKVPQMEDYWGSKSTMAKMATAISITLGGALQGLRGGPNPGLESTNREIDQWVASQREAYQRKRGEVDDADNQYAKMVQLFGSENLAEQNLRSQAYGVRDAMMEAYARKVGTPSALEAFNATQLESEAQRKAAVVKAYQDAGAEIEEKLSMQGGGGGGRAAMLQKALAAGADAEKNRRIITGEDKNGPGRAIERERTEALTGAIATIEAADGVLESLGTLGVSDDDTDDPRSGAYDWATKNIPGTQTRRTGQNLDQHTEALARGAQQFLGKSDNDANLAEKQAKGGGGSGRERSQSAQRLREKAVATLQDQMASMTPEQRDAYLAALPPDRAMKLRKLVTTSNAPAASARRVQ